MSYLDRLKAIANSMATEPPAGASTARKTLPPRVVQVGKSKAVAVPKRPEIQRFQKLRAWSYSVMSLWYECPRAAKFRSIDKVPTAGSAAMDRGTALHKQAELYIGKDIPTLPKELAKIKDYLVRARNAKTEKFMEQEWGFTSGWEPTGWVSKDTWLRAKLDLAYMLDKKTMLVVDHKSGKVYPDHAKQRHLYATCVMARLPQVEKVIAQMWYIDIGPEPTAEQTSEFTRAEYADMVRYWNARAQPMMNDDQYIPRPGSACRFCAYAKSKQGPCQYG